MTTEDALDRLAIDTIRTLSMDAVQEANSGHPGTPMALAPLGWLLFTRLRRHDPSHPEWIDRDRFVLSCGHASMLQYSLLHLTGYDLALDEIRSFRQWDSLTPGHPEVKHTPGVETTTGPLGQGFANAVGMAMAEQHIARRFNRPGHTVVDHRTWVIASDGDIMEGVCQEAASLAGHLRLGKLIVFWDDNRITIDGSTDLSFSEDPCKRFEAYGWHVESVEDGNDLRAIEHAAELAKADERPSFIRVRTIIGYPCPTKQGKAEAHGAPLGDEEIAACKTAMGWSHPKFHVPDEVVAVKQRVRARGEAAYGAHQEALRAYEHDHPELARQLRDAMAGKLPEGWDDDLPQFPPDPKGMATRKASGTVIAALAKRLDGFVGGSADLAGSNNTHQKGFADFQDRSATAPPRNVHWGIREHAMASACNGLALHGGVVPYAATFLIFSDYMRPAIRLAALMDVPVRYVFTHDSIGLGEDGPTHQPVEQIAGLRSVPNMTVIRPADANEVREAWKVALRRKGPVALVLTRQNVPTLDRGDLAGAEGLRRGAYILAESGEPDVILIATGSEVQLALEARKKLASQDVRARVVSMPSWELFEEQDRAYRESVLPPSVRARVVVEAGTRFGWERWVGPDGGFVTLERFGASAPADLLFEKLGFTPEVVAAEARATLTRAS
jgi:transketolase